MEQIYSSILVGIDGSDQSEQALNRAIRLTLQNDAKLYITHVVDTSAMSSFASRNIDYEELVDDKVYRILEKFEQDAKEAGVKELSTFVEFGSPRLLLSKTLVQTHDIDLIVVGATGMSAVGRMFLGSVSEHITRYASCDVIIVRDKEN